MRYLILNCDDFGQSEAANQAIIHLLEERKVSSATIMPPAPAFEQAAAWSRSKGKGLVGLHLTLTSEFDGFRWRSLTRNSKHRDESGHLYRTVLEFETNAHPKAVRGEILAQFKAVKEAGIEISHVDNHMGSLYGLETGRSYLPFVLWQCSRRGLPFRLFRQIYAKDSFLTSIPNAEETLARIVSVADLLEVPIPDYLLSHPYHIQEDETYEVFKKSLLDKIYDLPEGVSETYIHPAMDDGHMQRLIPSWAKRVWEYQLMLEDDFAYALKDAGVQLVNYHYVKQNLRRPRWGAARRLLFSGRYHS
ncbi:polysaccharide deacetylase family protein [Paenibacillus sp. SN-8-1]|uniref:polysaccharide deacetylase family protein n=1 Tax=Paenibacillus sp. SN-8-1 TaxID=3435409 RepID=UPI003D9AA0AD